MSWMAEMAGYHRISHLRQQAKGRPSNDSRDDHPEAHTSAPEQNLSPQVGDTGNRRP